MQQERMLGSKQFNIIDGLRDELSAFPGSREDKVSLLKRALPKIPETQDIVRQFTQRQINIAEGRHPLDDE